MELIKRFLTIGEDCLQKKSWCCSFEKILPSDFGGWKIDLDKYNIFLVGWKINLNETSFRTIMTISGGEIYPLKNCGPPPMRERKNPFPPWARKRAKWCLEVSWVFLGFPSVSHVPSRISDIRRAARAEPSQGDSRSGRHRISEIKSQVGGEIRTVAKRKSLDWFRILTSNLYFVTMDGGRK